MKFSCVLAIDTSTARGEVAVWKDGGIVFGKEFESERSHNSQMFSPLKEALDAAGDRLDLVVVGTGPGSYTGVRIGIAAAQGLAWSRGCPIVGIPSLAIPGVTGDMPKEWMMCGDARRGKFYVSKVVEGRLQGEIESVSADELRQRKGSWSDVRWFTYDPKAPAALDGIEHVKPSAERLASLVIDLNEEELQVAGLNGDDLEPVYLSAPFVTMAAQQGK